jgi:hypothetical protein
MDVKQTRRAIAEMNPVIAYEVSAKEVIGVTQVNQSVILYSRPGQDYPRDEPDAQQGQNEFIGLIDQGIILFFLTRNEIGPEAAQGNLYS